MVVALLGRSLRWRRRRPGSTDPEAQRAGFWQRWTDRVTRRPGASPPPPAARVLLVLAIPALSLEFGDGALRQFPEGNETRVGAELAAKELGAGASGPTQLVASFDEGTAADRANRAALAGWADDVGGRPRGGAGRSPPALATTAAPRFSRCRPSTTPRAPRRGR